MMTRCDGREGDALRPVTIQRGFTKYAEGSVMVAFGDTRVLCTASVEDKVPPFLRDSGQGWVTGEYAMLPRATHQRTDRSGYNRGRSLEISRLIGRSLRAVVDLKGLGERQITIDCDVFQADGGTRTAAITGAYVALHDALSHMRDKGLLAAWPMLGQCAAVSVGIIDGQPCLDLCYDEDSTADVDMNVIMRSDGTFIEVQATGEKGTFSKEALADMTSLAEKGILQLFDIQREALERE